jgi:hypothetical protein
LLLAVGHHAEGHGKHFFGGDAGYIGDGVQKAVDAEVRVIADFEVQVRSFVFDCAAEEIVDAECHDFSTLALAGGADKESEN